MKNNDLKEMRTQLAALNEKLEKENIVNENTFSKLTKRNMYGMERKLKIFIIVIAASTLPMLYLFGCYLLPLFLGLIVLYIFLIKNIKGVYSVSMSVRDCAKQIKRTIRVNKIASRIFMLYFLLFYLFLIAVRLWMAGLSINTVGTSFLLLFMGTMIGIILFVVYRTWVLTDIELMLNMILEDLEQEQDETTNDSAVS
ncbi:MAG: hypothetical protein ACTTKO_04145 [Candidatus Limimorpha sp.]